MPAPTGFSHNSQTLSRLAFHGSGQQGPIFAPECVIIGLLPLFCIGAVKCEEGEPKESGVGDKCFLPSPPQLQVVDVVEDNKLNGTGEMKLTNGTTLMGEFKDGKLDGYGRKTYVNGDFYEGGWCSGVEHGEGRIVMRPSKHFTYEGQLKDGKLTGTYKMIFNDGLYLDMPGATIEGLFKAGRPVLRQNFLANPNKMEKACLSRFYRLLMDQADGGFNLKTINTILSQLIPEHENLLSYQSIDEYIQQGCSNNCTLNVTRDDHSFLLGVEKGVGRNYRLNLYDSSGKIGKNVTVASASVSEDNLLDVLKSLNDEKKHSKFVDKFLKNPNLKGFGFMNQKTQTSGNCSLKCWFALLEHKLGPQVFHKVEATLFSGARDFFADEIKCKGKYSSQVSTKLAELEDLAEKELARGEQMVVKNEFRISNFGHAQVDPERGELLRQKLKARRASVHMS